MKAKHLIEEISEAKVPSWTIVVEDQNGITYTAKTLDFITITSNHGLVVISAIPPKRKKRTK